MHNRFLDKALLYKYKDDETFIKRSHGESLTSLICKFILVFVLISSLFLLSKYFTEWQIVTLVFIILSSLCFLIGKSFKRYQTVFNIIEFQNSLFASVAKMSSEFCAIIRYNGDVVYLSPEYKQIFSSNSTNIEQLCDDINLNENFKKQLLDAIKYKKNEIIDFWVTNNPNLNEFRLSIQPIETNIRENNQSKLNLTFNPIKHHSGYFFLKAIDNKKQTDISELLDKFDIASYSFYGNKTNFLNINKKLSKVLGYSDKFFKIKPNQFLNNQEYQQIVDKESFQNIISIRKLNNEEEKAFISQLTIKNEDQVEKHGLIIPLNKNLLKNSKNEDDQIDIPDIVKNLPIATIILDKNRNTIYYNEIFQNLFSLEKERSDINFITDMIDNSDREKVNNYIKNLLNKNIQQKPLDIKLLNSKIDNISLYIRRSDDNLICSLIDITEVKDLKQSLAHSQKMQAIGQLAGGIAHDFNNLLTAIIGFCDLLLMRHTAGDPSFVEIMQIKQNGNRAAGLVAQLMAFSRKQTLQPKVINVTNVIADLSTLLDRLIGENIELIMEYDKNLSYVRIDKGQFEQVIMNLAVNSRDAMPNGGKLIIRSKNIYIKDENQLGENMFKQDDEPFEPDNYVLIEVIDSGCGMSQEIVEKIFEPFFSTKEIGYGTGLGLSTVYGIIKQMEGYIYLLSKEGEGTHFIILLKSYIKEKEEDKEKIVNAEDHIDLTGKANILLVEDETPVRIFTTRALTNKGYKITEARNGEEAIDLVKTKGTTIDLIITDVIMPGKSGVSIVEEISKEYPSIKVIFISGYPKNELSKIYKDNQKFNFLPKPYTIVELSKKIKEVLSDN